MSTVSAIMLALALMTATVLGEGKQWLNDKGGMEYAPAEAYGFVDRNRDISLEAHLEEMEQTDDGKAVIRLTLLNKGGSVLLYNPGFNERTPAAGTVATFDGQGHYSSKLNWPPVGYMTARTDWVKLERGQGFVTTWRGSFRPGTHRIQVIYWRWLLEPLPAAGQPLPDFHEEGLTGRKEIMRSNIIDIAVPPKSAAGGDK